MHHREEHVEHFDMLDASGFLRKLFDALAIAGLDTTDLELDHLCYRVETHCRFDALRKALNNKATLLGDSIIGKRPIATYRLNEPIFFEGRRIEVVELPAPKTGRPYPEGYEHAEFVVLEELVAFTQRHPHLDWDLSALAKPVNADVRLRFDGFSVKFHRQTLASVIEMEHAQVARKV